MHRGTLGSHWDSCLETGLWEEGLDSQRNLPPQSQPPSVAASPFSPQPAKGGVWPARGAGGGQAGEIPSISPPAAGTGFQEFGSPAARTLIQEGQNCPGQPLRGTGTRNRACRGLLESGIRNAAEVVFTVVYSEVVTRVWG